MVKSHTHIVLLFALILSSMTMLSPEVKASSNKKDIFDRFKRPMPEIKLMSEEDFNSKTKYYNKTPYDQDVLAYSIRVDKNWIEAESRSSSNFSLSEKLFTELNKFYSKPSIHGRSRLEIQALNLDGNLTAEQWYIKFILEGGYTTEGMVVHGENKVESLMIIMEKDTSYYLRTLITLNGNKVIMAQYYVPANVIKYEAVMQAQVLKSFKISSYVERKFTEMQNFRMLDIAEIFYPEAWKAIPKPIRSTERLNLSIINLKESTTINSQGVRKTESAAEGKLEIELVSSAVKTTLLEEIVEFKKGIESTNIIIGDKLSTLEEQDYNEVMDFGITEVYKGIDAVSNKSDYEVWFTVMVGGNYYYLLTMVTPSRNDAFATWAENTQHYRIMISRFTPMIGAFLKND